jgi:FMN phosphatase YigB (HAD superfamily)
MMKIKTLLIDLDGTLLGAHSTSLNFYFTYYFVKSLRKYGFSVFQSLRLLHKLKLSMRESSHQMNGIINWDKAVAFFSQLSGKNLTEAREILTTTSMECFKKSSPTIFPIPEAIEFINWAKNHFRLILATNPLWPLDVVHYRLSVAEIHESNFEFITHAGIMSSSKPYVEYYKELKQMKELIPESCLMIGNDEKKDGPARLIGTEVFIIKSAADFKVLRAKLEQELL